MSAAPPRPSASSPTTDPAHPGGAPGASSRLVFFFVQKIDTFPKCNNLSNTVTSEFKIISSYAIG